MATPDRAPADEFVAAPREAFVHGARAQALEKGVGPVRPARQRGVMPIVFAPGVMGTRLSEPATRARVWDPLGYPPAANVVRMRDPTPLAPNPDQADYLGVRNFGNLVSTFYERITMRLAVANPVYVAGYDWRQDNAKSAQRFGDVVDDALRFNDASQAIVVAHSMGGLVSRWYCRYGTSGASQAHKVRALILLASPTHGTPKAYGMLKAAHGWDVLLRLLFYDLRHAVDLVRFLRLFPSAYQLLPTAEFCRRNPAWLSFASRDAGGLPDARDPVPLYSNSHVGFLEHPDPVTTANLDARRAFDAALGTYMPPNTYVLYGRGLPTVGRYAYLNIPRTAVPNVAAGVVGVRRRLSTPLTPIPRLFEVPGVAPTDGDGTVVPVSGSSEGCQVQGRLVFNGLTHDRFCNEPPVIDAVQGIVRAVTTPGRAPPARRRGP